MSPALRGSGATTSSDGPRIATTVVGAGGLLGSAMAARSGRGEPRRLSGLPWGDPHRASLPIRDAHTAALAERPDVLLVCWCAGTGRVGTPAAALASETTLLRRVLEDLERLPTGDTQVVVAYASSAGAVWSGSPHVVLDEDTPAEPWHDYGRVKLEQEALLRATAERTGFFALVARISNLFGPPPTGRRLTGLVNTLAYNAVRRIPTGIYVPIDTQRDYISAAAAAAIMEQQALALLDEPAGTVRTQVVAAGRSYTIGALADTIARVLGRAVPLTVGYSASASQQPRTLVFRSRRLDLHQRSEHIAHDLQQLVTAFASGRWRPPAT